MEQIRAQLQYREENKAAVAAFHTTRSLGENTMLLVGEDTHRFVVADARDLTSANPDVQDFSMVTGVDLDVEEDASEAETEDKDGNRSVTKRRPPRQRQRGLPFLRRVHHPQRQRLLRILRQFSFILFHATKSSYANQKHHKR